MLKEYPGDSIKRLQASALEILEVIDALCKKHNIEYCICAGTCLGAVRHKGFIPWDDDVDLAMPYADYVRFLDVVQHDLPHGFSWHTPLNTQGFSTLWTKIYKDGTRYIATSVAQAGCEQGIFVDVFPYIQLDTNEKRAKKQRAVCLTCQRKLYLHYIAHPYMPKSTPFYSLKQTLCALVHHTIARLWTPQKITQKLEPYLTCKNPSDSWINVGYAQGKIMDGSWLWPAQNIKFEEIWVKAPAKLHEYLTAEYGDYMTPPPHDQRHYDLPSILDFGDGVNVMDESSSC